MEIDSDVPDSWNYPENGITYSFNEKMVLVDSEGNQAPKSITTNNDFSNWVHAYVQKRLLEKGLVVSIVGGEGGAPIFHTPNAFKNPKKLLLLCCGSGRIHAGLWSVSICGHYGLIEGTVLPCLDDAQKRGIEVVIFNPNHSGSKILTKRYPKLYGMIAHTLCVYEDFIIPGNPEHVFIICHSMGGSCTLSAIEKFPEWFLDHVEAVAMTDAVEMKIHNQKSLNMKKWSYEHCINWVCSEDPIDTILPEGVTSVHRSAGTIHHALSTGMAYPYIWTYFDSFGAENGQYPPHQSYIESEQ